MAAKNSVKQYLENSFYHLYNRGVEKRNIFLDAQDFSVFCSYLKTYLLPKNEDELREIISSKDPNVVNKDKALKLISLKNFAGDIELLAYCLIPNHFHLLVRQKSSDGIDRFMNALGVRYAVYFNHKYKRVGPLYQGVYKAVLVNSDEQLLHLSRYIHLNPFRKLNLETKSLSEVSWPFSLPEYLNNRTTEWIKTNYVLDYFRQNSQNNSYESFIDEASEPEVTTSLTIDLDDE